MKVTKYIITLRAAAWRLLSYVSVDGQIHNVSYGVGPDSIEYNEDDQGPLLFYSRRAAHDYWRRNASRLDPHGMYTTVTIDKHYESLYTPHCGSPLI